MSSVGGRLRSSRVALRKRFGQHVLKNVDLVRKIVAAAEIAPDEHVMEIGPGTGNITVPLLQVSQVGCLVVHACMCVCVCVCVC